MSVTAIRPTATPAAHPAWCVLDPDDSHHIHHGHTTQVPATAGPFRVSDVGIEMARVDTSVTVGPVTRGVFLEVFDPRDPHGDRGHLAQATLSPDEARALAAALYERAALAEAEV